MSFVFGPLPSRRLGQSLGVDPLPLKVCNWNCVYCQLGRTTPLSNTRGEYFPRADILAEIRSALAAHKPGAIDWVTFVGSGETTLHSGIGWLLRQVKDLTDIPVAVITNGSLLHVPEVRQELLVADVVMPSFDAGSEVLYRRINRPWPGLGFTLLLDGLIAFRNEYRGRLWVEVMLMRGLNDSESALQDIAGALRRIRPDQVHVNLPSRPPAEPTVELPDDEGLKRATEILGGLAQIVHPSRGGFDLSLCEHAAEAVIAIISRHPMREEELRRTLERWSPGQVEEALQELAAGGAAQIVERHGERFWSAAGCCYPPDAEYDRGGQRAL
jgi:wyosine [tRNA(Phe)-imidazoG37] synthetase (radical SAM superfamily)